MADGEHGFLGLTHNPFTEESDAFFPGGDRQTHLDQLRHLSQWSRRVLIVTGPEGVGKTMLFRQLSMTLEPRVKAARINAVLVNSAKDVLGAIVQGFGISPPTDSSPQSVSNTIVTTVINQDRQGRFCLVMVDDAHRLAFQALEELLKISKSCPMRVLLFGEPTIIGMAARSAERLEVEWHEMRLTGYSEADIEAYLTWRFEQAQYRDKLPFASDQVQKLAKVSGGLPGEINRIAGELVSRLESGEDAQRRRFPTAHRLLVVLLLALVGVAYLIFSDSDAKRERHEREVAEVTQIELPPVEVVDDAVDDEPIRPVEQRPDPASDEQSPTVVAEAVDDDADPASEENAIAEAVVSTAVATQDPEPASTSEPERAPEVEAVEPPAPAVETASREVEPDPVPVTESAPDRVAAGLGGGLKDTDWLLAQSPDRYTLQLVSVSSKERVDAFVSRQRQPGDFAWYTIDRDGRTLYVITYGLFSDKDAASEAAANMPPEVGDLEPWVRQMRYVQDAAR